jgi:DNA repair photolyase
MARYIIGASYIMSSLCYSVFKVEPCPTCPFNCVYCYARKSPAKSFLTFDELSFRVFISRFLRLGVKPFFRLSTLVDPFQPIEVAEKKTLKILQIFNELEIPIIINTKSDLVAQEPWINEVLRLADKDLIVIQFSIAFLDNEAKVLELFASPPSRRLKALEILSASGIPATVRLQPLVPYLNTEYNYLAQLLNEAKTAGAKHVIAENIRILTRSDLEALQKVCSNCVEKIEWERILKTPWKRPSRAQRDEALHIVMIEATKRGLTFATCREGMFKYHTAPNCCGLHLLSKDIQKQIFLRPTLYEYWQQRQGRIGLEEIRERERIIEKLGIKELEEHHKLLQQVLNNPELLQQIAPHIT